MSDTLEKTKAVIEQKTAETVKDFATVPERIIKPYEASKKTAMAIYDPKAMLAASAVTGAIGIHNALNVPPILAGGVPLAAGLGAVGYAAAAVSLRNSHHTAHSRQAYDMASLTSLSLTGYSALRFTGLPKGSPTVATASVVALGIIGAASLFTNGMKSYEIRHGKIHK